ncbi:MAG TPA: GvpL/GvpF family gas vesicle protein [Actinocatenispora sp.]
MAAVYVYGIVPADTPVPGDATGVGDPPAEVTTVRSGDIAALVSPIETAASLGRPEDMLAHQRVLDAVAAADPVLPLTFGAALTDADAVGRELLDAHHDEFAAALAELRGRAEYLVTARYVRDAVLGEVLREHPELAELRDAIAGRSEELTHQDRIRLGEGVNTAVAAKREADTRAVADLVTPHAVQAVVREPAHELDAARVAVLTDLDAEDDLTGSLAELAEDWRGRVEIRVRGPLAPYDFVATVR